MPTFYDSIEIARDRMVAKFHRRAERWHALPAFLMTFVEAVLTLVFVRLIFRVIMRGAHKATGRGRPATVPLAKATTALRWPRRRLNLATMRSWAISMLS